MKRAPRNILFAGVTLIFLVTAPILILYALGYRYDAASQALRKTGSIVVQFLPQNSEVFLDGASLGTQQDQTLISGLTKAQYRVRVAKNGYDSWEKVLPISAGEVTWAQNIILFFEQLQYTNLTGPENITARSENNTGTSFALISGQDAAQQISFYKAGTEKALATVLASTLSAAAPKARNIDYSHMIWVNGDAWVLVPYKNAIDGASYIALTTTTGEAFDLGSHIPSNANIVNVGNTNQIGFVQNNRLTLFTLKKNTKEELEKTFAFITKGLHDFRVRQEDKTCSFEQRNIVTGSIKKIADLACENYSASITPAGNVLLSSATKHLLYFNISTNQLTDVSTNATEFHPALAPVKKTDRIFFGNGKEVYVFDAKTQETGLVTRTADPILAFLPNELGTHAYILNKNLLTAHEAMSPAPLRSTSWKIAAPISLLAVGSNENTITVLTQDSKTKTNLLQEARTY